MSNLSLLNISKSFSQRKVLDQISLKMDQEGILCILGPSGCGKTTLLRVIAGLEKPDTGTLFLNGEDLTRKAVHKRNFGFMFQDYALFPHKNVYENIAFGLRMKKENENTIRSVVLKLMERLGLERFSESNVDDLSGGERQRVALARCLATSPRLLLLDEPFASLDRRLRKNLAAHLARIIKKIGILTIFVTHDHLEAFTIADTIAVMEKGKIQQMAPPEVLYKHPANASVAAFLGFKNMFPYTLRDQRSVIASFGSFHIEKRRAPFPEKGVLLLRPECATPLKKVRPRGKDEITIFGKIIQRIFQGNYYTLIINTNNNTRLSFTFSPLNPPPAEQEMIGISYPIKDIVFLNGSFDEADLQSQDHP